MKCLGSQVTCAGKLALAFILMHLIPAPVQAGVSAHLRQEATVSGAVVTLGDVAKIDGDSKSISVLAAVELGPSPLPGKSRSLGADYVRIRLRQKKLDPAVLAEDSAVKCHITRSCQKVSPDMLIELAQAYIEQLIEPGDCRLVVEPISRLKELVLPEGRLELVPSCPGNTSGSSRRVVVQALVDGIICGRVEISIRIHRYVRVAVAAVPIPKGEKLSPDCITYEERDLMSLSQDVITESESLEGLQALTAISTGSIITRKMAAEPPLVRRGDAVTLRVQVGGIMVSAAAVASEDGRSGQLIRVKNASSNQELKAKIVDSKTVEVLM